MVGTPRKIIGWETTKGQGFSMKNQLLERIPTRLRGPSKEDITTKRKNAGKKNNYSKPQSHDATILFHPSPKMAYKGTIDRKI